MYKRQVNDYHGYAEGKFGIVREAKKQAGNGGLTYSINGNIVDEDQWKAEEEAWQASKITYRVNYGDYSNIIPVSYTHLDVYKRQFQICTDASGNLYCHER